MARFYLPTEEWDQPSPTLRGDEARHAAKVLRMKEGSSCVVFDGKGKSASASIEHIRSSSEVSLRISDITSGLQELPKLTLCQSIPKGGNMDLIIQKAVELGVSAIIPIVTDRTIVRFNNRDAEAKQEKWQRTALEACKQCGQNLIPAVSLPATFKEWIGSHQQQPGHLAIIASLAEGARPIREVLENARVNHCRNASVLVGPEGDFTPEETRQALDAGFTPVTLGPIVMRVETATFFSLSALRYSLD